MKKVLITGASRGIGRACAEEFARGGWQVYVNCARSVELLREVAESIPGCIALPYDVSDRGAVYDAIGGMELDCLINNAGKALFSPFDAVTPEQEKELYGTDLFGVLNCTRAVLPSMIRRRTGVIINIASMWGETGASCEVDYSAAKGAVIAFTKALAKEVGPSGVRVVCISPGAVDTDMNSRLTVREYEELVDSVPLERMGLPEDIASAAAFLASERASYITGSVIDVNGGLI